MCIYSNELIASLASWLIYHQGKEKKKGGECLTMQGKAMKKKHTNEKKDAPLALRYNRDNNAVKKGKQSRSLTKSFRSMLFSFFLFFILFDVLPVKRDTVKKAPISSSRPASKKKKINRGYRLTDTSVVILMPRKPMSWARLIDPVPPPGVPLRLLSLRLALPFSMVVLLLTPGT